MTRLSPDGGPGGDGPGVTCSGCASSAPDRPVTWSLERGPAGERWLCERCTRDHVRSIEAKLDAAWW